MKEITIKIKFDDEGGYKGHGDDISEVIRKELNVLWKLIWKMIV